MIKEELIYCRTKIVSWLVKIGKIGTDNFEQCMYHLKKWYVIITGLQRRFVIEVEDYDEKIGG